jgi:hypothetical protein
MQQIHTKSDACLGRACVGGGWRRKARGEEEAAAAAAARGGAAGKRYRACAMRSGFSTLLSGGEVETNRQNTMSTCAP